MGTVSMLNVACGLGISFLFGLLLAVVVFLSSNRQKIINGIRLLLAMKSGKNLGNGFKNILSELFFKPSFLMVGWRGVACENFQIDLPWGTFLATRAESQTLLIEPGFSPESAKIRAPASESERKEAKRLQKCLYDFPNVNVLDLCDKDPAEPKDHGRSCIVLWGQGSLFEKAVTVSFPWGVAKLHLSNPVTICVPVEKQVE